MKLPVKKGKGGGVLQGAATPPLASIKLINTFETGVWVVGGWFFRPVSERSWGEKETKKKNHQGKKNKKKDSTQRTIPRLVWVPKKKNNNNMS